MENKEFIVEAIKRLLPDTSWYGESNHDSKSVKNIDIMRDVLYEVLDNINNDSVVPAGNRGNGSFEEIAKKKQEVIKELFSYYTGVDLDEVIEHYKATEDKEQLTDDDLKESHDLLKPLALLFE